MATAVVSIICIALIVIGGMAMSQGILSSADASALSIEEISVREGEIMRTEVGTVRASHLSWADLLRVTVENNGQTKLASFSKWDFIVRYNDGDGNDYIEWLPYTDGALGDNEWQKARIGLNGPTEFFEPGIMNPEEELVILAKLNPLPGDNTTGEVIVSTPNGISDSISFSCLDYTPLTPHSENTTIAGTDYYELVEATPSDGTAATMMCEFAKNERGRKALYNENQPSRLARHVFPLTGISNIPAATWTVYYRCNVWGIPTFPRSDGDVYFNIDILIRQADGTIRTMIAEEVADAEFLKIDEGTWVTNSATYDFPGYTVEDDNDYLEIVYYGDVQGQGPAGGSGYMQIRIDDNTLAEEDQTRIEA